MRLNWLPNAISIFRIVLIVPIVLLVEESRFADALIVFFVAGFSDGLDGFLARRCNWHTRLGALLDPIADKLMIASTYITLAWVGQVPLWLAVVVVGRDVVIIGGATAYNFLVAPVRGEPTHISKLNTALELLFVVTVLAQAAFAWPAEIVVTMLGAAVFVTVVISGIDYVVAWSERARRERRSNGSANEA
jgi:cardiolipin synthase